MPRIRAVKPEFWSSPNHPDDPWTRLLFIAMWNWADDAGVGTANLRELAGFAFPNDDHIDARAMRRMCADIAAHYGAQFYTVANRPYYSIPSWREHQKFDKRREGKHPGPDEAEKWLYQDGSDESAQRADNAPTMRGQCGAVSAPEIGTGEVGTGEQFSPALSEFHSPARARENESEREHPESSMILIPDDWSPNDLHHAKHPRPDLDDLADGFRDHATATGRRCHGRGGWDAAFSNWVRKSKPPGTPASTTDARIAAAQALKTNVHQLRGLES